MEFTAKEYARLIEMAGFSEAMLKNHFTLLKEAGFEVTVAAIKSGAIKGKHGYELAVEKSLDEVKPDEYAIMILPGGAAPRW